MFGNAQGSLGHVKQDENSDTLERSFDPLWRNAITLLRYLTDAELLLKEAATARIGQLVQITGRISILNTEIMQRILLNQTMRDIAIGNLSKTIDRNPGESPSQHRKKVSGLMDFIGALPYVTQLGIQTPSDIFWGILTEDNMIVSATDHLYKTGGSLPGSWTTIGVLDALPDARETQEGMPLSLLGTIGEMFGDVSGSIRGMVGRPKSAFGITPLLVMREVSSAQSDPIGD